MQGKKQGMDRRFLYYSAAAFWGIPGMIITVKGIKAYLAMPSHKLWWLLLITAFFVVGFFNNVSKDCG